MYLVAIAITGSPDIITIQKQVTCLNLSRTENHFWQFKDYTLTEIHHSSLKFLSSVTSEALKPQRLIYGIKIGHDPAISSGSWIEISFNDSDKQLTILRDPAGLMAAFFTRILGGYLVSDSVPLLLQFSGISRQIDLAALNEYWFLDYCIPPKTIWTAIRAVPNGHRVLLTLGREQAPEYTQFYFPGSHGDGQRLNPQDAPKKLRQVILDATENLLASHPVGPRVNLLSGGIDSSVVFAACNLLGYKPDLAITYKGEGDADESTLAAITAARFGVPLEVVSIEGTDIISDAYGIARTWGQPYSHGSVTAMQAMLANMPSDSILITGDGGGEAFVGAPAQNTVPLRWAGNSLHRLISHFPRRSQLAAYKSLAIRHHYGRALFYWLELSAAKDELDLSVNKHPITEIETKLCFQSGLQAALSKREVRKEFARIVKMSRLNPRESLFAKTLFYYWGPEGVYAKTCRLADAAGIYTVAPLAASEYVETVKSIDLVDRGLRKQALRDSFIDVLPTELLNAPKRGLMPINRKLLGFAAPKGIEWIKSTNNAVWDKLFDEETIVKFWQAHADQRVFRTTLLYKAIVFRCWSEIWHPEMPHDIS